MWLKAAGLIEFFNFDFYDKCILAVLRCCNLPTWWRLEFVPDWELFGDVTHLVFLPEIFMACSVCYNSWSQKESQT